ncbi:MAG: F(420)H(2) dehydrogenase subunit L [Methanomassiliicoccales archaeon PtaU1.Bin124]|nr:MAG: F(420)H(2) dehydrogenase subunit L [Methanomassiliicoccales archaeon PtaU1.Bin124]
MMIELILLLPLIAAAISYFVKQQHVAEAVSMLSGVLQFILALLIAVDVMQNGAIQYGLWYADELSVFMLVIITFLGSMAVAYSFSYIGHDREEHEISGLQLRRYYLLLQLFLFTMLVVVLTNNLGIMWIAIEGTTLTSAFLVGFYEKDTSLEAAWKYLIICSVGISMALFGVVLTYASSVDVAGFPSDSLNWTDLRSVAALLDPTFLRIAFIFILIGYGTKVGFVPMHTWLPDAHSQAPSPISAMLSGVLLNCALYGILRFYIIMQLSVPGFAPDLLLIFGVISLVMAAAFIILAKDFKRLLAYSSIEHMGIIALGFGIGGFLGIFAGLLHMLNHALTKCLMFFGAGNILQKYNTRSIAEVRGLAYIMPITAALFLLGALAITGSPPFSIFLSEVMVLQAGLGAGSYLVVAIYLFAILVIFAAFMYHVSKMLFGKPTEGVVRGEIHHVSLIPMAILLVSILVIGLFLPQQLMDFITKVAALFPGGSR